jgi:hypothetical protein
MFSVKMHNQSDMASIEINPDMNCRKGMPDRVGYLEEGTPGGEYLQEDYLLSTEKRTKD